MSAFVQDPTTESFDAHFETPPVTAKQNRNPNPRTRRLQ